MPSDRRLGSLLPCGPATCLTGSMKVHAARTRSTIWFAVFVTACAAAFRLPLRSLIQMALGSDTYSHILVIPFISVVLVWMERERVFQSLGCNRLSAGVLFCAGASLGVLGWRASSLSPEGDWLTLTTLGFLCLIWAGFLFFYGASPFKAGLFPLLFLLLMAPLPGFLLDRFTAWLQVGSADVTQLIFHWTGTPALRQGLFFTLPQVTIVVAKECSGIRSAQALLITCLLTGHLFLRSNWRRTALLAAAVPVLIIKNGVRIATLTLLAVRVDPSFLNGHLHHDGGFVFFGLGMVILLPLFRWFQKTEAASRGTRLNVPVLKSEPA
jgi:exosortase